MESPRAGGVGMANEPLPAPMLERAHSNPSLPRTFDAPHRAVGSGSFAGLPGLGTHQMVFSSKNKDYGFCSNKPKEEHFRVQRQVSYVSAPPQRSFVPPAVLHYNTRYILRPLGSVALLWTKARSSTYFTARELRTKIAIYIALLFAIFFVMSWRGRGPEPKFVVVMGSMNTWLSSGMFFLMGLYVSAAVGRWWAIREQGVGALWRTIDDLVLWSSCWFADGSAHDEAACALVARLGRVSFALLAKECRYCMNLKREDLEVPEYTEDYDQLIQEAASGDARMTEIARDDALTICKAGLGDLVASGELTVEEALTLAPLDQMSQCVWAWLTLFWTRAFSSDESDAREPQLRFPRNLTRGPGAAIPANTYGVVLSKCAEGRAAIKRVLTYIVTQQPLAYVHLLAFMTTIASLVNVVATAAALYEARKTIGSSPSADGFAWISGHMFVAALRVVLYPFLFDGLLLIGSGLENPLGQVSRTGLPVNSYDEPAPLPSSWMTVQLKASSWNPPQVLPRDAQRSARVHKSHPRGQARPRLVGGPKRAVLRARAAGGGGEARGRRRGRRVLARPLK